MAGDAYSDPLYHSNRRKVKQIITNYCNPNQEPTLSVDEKRTNQDVIREQEAILKWSEFHQKYEPRLKSDFEKVREKKRFCDLVYNGIPEAFRIKYWLCLLGINGLNSDDDSQYELIKENSKRYARLEDVFQIDKDVQRTFRDRAEFKKEFSKRQCMLFNVLMAYSYYNDTLGYCQGMHQCAGLLLLYVPDEKSAFWGLHRLMVNPRYALHGMFLYEFPKYIRLREDFERILRKKNKSLYNHLMECQTVTDTYLMLWYFTVFQADFPLSLSLRIWDIFLLEGDIIFLPMAYTLITYKEKELKREECPKLYITKFKETLQYEESNIIELFKRNFRAMMQSSKRPLRAEPPLGEIPAEFGTLMNRTDVESNGYDDVDVEITAETEKKENKALIERVKDSAFKRSDTKAEDRISFIPYESPSVSQTDIPMSIVGAELRNGVTTTSWKGDEVDSKNETANLELSASIENEAVSKISYGAKLSSQVLDSNYDSAQHLTPVNSKSDQFRGSGGGDVGGGDAGTSGKAIKSVRLFKKQSPSSPQGAIAQLPSKLNQLERRSSNTPTNQRSRNSSQNSKFSERGREETDGGLTSNDESLGGGSVNFEPLRRRASGNNPDSPISPVSGTENDVALPAKHLVVRAPKNLSKRNANSTGYLTSKSSHRISNSPHSSAEIDVSEQQSVTYESTRRGFLYGTQNHRTSRTSARSSLSPIALPDSSPSGRSNPRYTLTSPNESYYNSSIAGSVGGSSAGGRSRLNQTTLPTPPKSFLYTQGVAEKLAAPRYRNLGNRNSWSSDINYRPSTTSRSERLRGRIGHSSHRSPEPTNISRFAENHERFFVALHDAQKLETEFSVNGGAVGVASPPRRGSNTGKPYVTVKRDGSGLGRLNVTENGSIDVKSRKSTSKKQGSKSVSGDKTKAHVNVNSTMKDSTTSSSQRQPTKSSRDSVDL